MIKITFIGNQPNMYQIDKTHNMPSITGAVQWNGATKCLEVSTGSGWQRIDNNIEMNSSGPDLWEMHRWIEEKKREEAELKVLRNKYPALDEAYKHMELIKALVKSGPVQEDTEVQASP